jgi:two-component system copper resistance phosphate regulon response regulator CusR
MNCSTGADRVRLLVIEDDPALRGVLVRGLEANGYIADAAGSAQNAIDLLRFTDYAVLIVDWRLPGMSGLDLVKHVRSKALDSAVLMLTARDAPADRISGLDAGADDYLIKPFDFGELLARVRALQRRPGSPDGRVLRRGTLELDPQTRTVLAGGLGLHLTTTEFRILELLMLKAPAIVDRRQIAQHGWKDETDPIGSNAIDVRMARLRAKLAGSGTQILTVRGAGYRLAER